VHADRVAVTDLIQELEGCDPDAEVRLAQQPAWPFEYAIDPTNTAVQVDLDSGPVVYLGEGAQLGYLPQPAREQLGWSPPTRSHGSEPGTLVHPERRRQWPTRVCASDLEATMPEDPTQPRYPDVQVQLSGEDGNAFAILGRTAGALRAAGVPQEEIDEFFAEATSGDYDHLLQTTMAWVDWA